MLSEPQITHYNILHPGTQKMNGTLWKSAFRSISRTGLCAQTSHRMECQMQSADERFVELGEGDGHRRIVHWV